MVYLSQFTANNFDLRTPLINRDVLITSGSIKLGDTTSRDFRQQGLVLYMHPTTSAIAGSVAPDSPVRRF